MKMESGLMPKLQLNTTKKADVIISVFKARNGLKTKAEAANKIIEMAGDQQ